MSEKSDENRLEARIAQLEEELRSCDCTGQCCSNDSINPNCTTHRCLLIKDTDEWLAAKLAEARDAESARMGKTVRCLRDANWLDALGDHRDIPEPLTREAIQSVFEDQRRKTLAEAAAFVKSKVSYNMLGGSVWQWPPSQPPPYEQILALGSEPASVTEAFSPRVAQLELALEMALDLADSTDDDLPTGWRTMREEAGAALDAPTTGKWLEKHDAQVLGKMQSELDELLLTTNKIHEEEFLRRAMAMETDNRDNLTPLGKMLVGLHKKAEDAFKRGHDAALSASTACTNCDSPGHFRPNDDEALCGECVGGELYFAKLLLEHLAEDGGVLTKSIQPETEGQKKLKELGLRAANRLIETNKMRTDDIKAFLRQRKEWLDQAQPYMTHLGCCCRGLPSALRPCNCGLFDLLGPISDREKEKRKEHKELGPFPNKELIDNWIKQMSR